MRLLNGLRIPHLIAVSEFNFIRRNGAYNLPGGVLECEVTRSQQPAAVSIPRIRKYINTTRRRSHGKKITLPTRIRLKNTIMKFPAQIITIAALLGSALSAPARKLPAPIQCHPQLYTD